MSAPAAPMSGTDHSTHLGPVPVPLTEMAQALQQLDQINTTMKQHADALNNLGANVQWIVDNVQGIFQMFNSPQFTAMMPGIMGAAAKGIPDGNEG